MNDQSSELFQRILDDAAEDHASMVALFTKEESEAYDAIRTVEDATVDDGNHHFADRLNTAKQAIVTVSRARSGKPISKDLTACTVLRDGLVACRASGFSEEVIDHLTMAYEDALRG